MSLDDQIAACRKEVTEVKELITGDPYNPGEHPGVLGRLQTIEEALWGPRGRPNGIVGMVKEMRVTTRTTIIALAAAAAGVILPRVLG